MLWWSLDRESLNNFTILYFIIERKQKPSDANQDWCFKIQALFYKFQGSEIAKEPSQGSYKCLMQFLFLSGHDKWELCLSPLYYQNLIRTWWTRGRLIQLRHSPEKYISITDSTCSESIWRSIFSQSYSKNYITSTVGKICWIIL